MYLMCVASAEQNTLLYQKAKGNNMSKITIVVAGATNTGKSFIKHQIAKHLHSLGLQVDVDETELNMRGVMSRRDNPEQYVQAIKLNHVSIELTEQQLTRSIHSKS